MKVRLAVESDADEIATIWNHYIRDTGATFNSVEKTTAELTDMIKARPGFFVVRENGLLLGFATYGQFRGGVGYAQTMEHTVLLSAETKGRGLGRALMHAVENHARAGGAYSMFAGVSAENLEGVAFHLALGYEQVARLPEVGYKFGRRLDLVLLQKRL